MSEQLCGLVLIKRNGQDGPHYPVYTAAKPCVFGRDLDCDVRIQLSNVSRQHARLYAGESNEPWIENLSKTNKTCINDNPLEEPIRLKHGDIIKIADRLFRCELPADRQLPSKLSPPLAETQELGVVSGKGETPKKTTRRSSGSENSEQRLSNSSDPNTVKERTSEENKMAVSPAQQSLTTPIRNTVEKTDFRAKESPQKNSSKSLPGSMSPRPLKTHGRSSPLVGQSSMVKQCFSSGKKISGSHSHSTLSPVLEEAASSPTTPSAQVDIPDSSSDHQSEVTPSHKRIVRFGPMLSPEEFDKRLPPNTPVKIGKTPTGRRRSSPGVVSGPQNSQLKKRLSVVMAPAGEEKSNHTVLASMTEANIRKTNQSPLCIETEKSRENLQNTSDSSMNMEATGATKVTETDDLYQLSASPKKQTTTLAKKSPQNVQLQAARKMITPVRKQIESGTQLRATHKRMGTPMRHAIEKGAQLRQLRKRMNTPIHLQIESGVQLKATRKKMGTPLRHSIEKGCQLQQLVKKMATPTRREIESGIQLKAVKKKMPTPLRHAIKEGTQLRKLKKKMTTPLRQEIKQGVELKKTRKQLATPLRQEIEHRVDLKKTRKKMATPMRQAIQQGIKLKSLRNKIMTPLRKEIENGTQLRKTKKRMATPLKQAIQQGTKLKKQQRKKMATPLRNEIKKGLTLRSATSKKAAPLQRVKLIESLPNVDATMTGSEIMKSESHQAKDKKKADIKSRVKLTPVRRLKPSRQLVQQRVFHFSAATHLDDSMMSPAPKRARKTQPKELVLTPPLDGLKRLVKTPKIKRSTSVPENNFQPGMFATPRETRSKVGSSHNLALDGIQRLMKTPGRKHAHEDQDQSPSLSGIQRLVRTPHYVLRPVSQSLPLDGISRLLKSPVTKQSPQPVENHFNPSLFKTPKTQSKMTTSPQLDGLAHLMKTPKEKNAASLKGTFQYQSSSVRKVKNDLLSPEKYFNTHLFDMVRADEEEIDMTGFVDIFQSPPTVLPAVSASTSQPSRQLSTRTRKRTVHVNLEDEQPVKRQRCATAKEAMESVEGATTLRRSRRKATMLSAPVVSDTVTIEPSKENMKSNATAAMTRTRRKTVNQDVKLNDSLTGAKNSCKQNRLLQRKITEKAEQVQSSPVSTRSKRSRGVAKDTKQLTRKTVKFDKEVQIEEIAAPTDYSSKLKTRSGRKAPSLSTQTSTRPTTRSRTRSQAASLLKYTL